MISAVAFLVLALGTVLILAAIWGMFIDDPGIKDFAGGLLVGVFICLVMLLALAQLEAVS